MMRDDPRADIYNQLKGQRVRFWISLRPEVVVSGELVRVVDSSSYKGLLVQTENGLEQFPWSHIKRGPILDKKEGV